LFKQIKVVAKVVVGTSGDELREITNSNNRQNPIDNWQLFSNEPIHVEIEAALKDLGVFYERQKGRFNSVMKNSENARHFSNTNGTYVQILDLGQVIALARKNLQWAAKPSEIFVNRERHDTIFARDMPKYPRDIIFVTNLYKAMKRGLNKYLELPTHANSNAPIIFKRQNVRAHVFYLALLHFCQHPSRRAARSDFSKMLYKRAHPRLVEDLQGFYMRLVSKVKVWYTTESKDLSEEIGKKKMDAFFDNLATELGVDIEGAAPFSEVGIDWCDVDVR
jgi:hypothetical protein